jgi:hypothetical protein
MLKAAGAAGIQWMTDLCNAVVAEGKIPEDWKKSWMVGAYKGKADALECGSYRGIKLLDQLMKVLERVIEKRVRDKINFDDMHLALHLAEVPLMQNLLCVSYNKSSWVRSNSCE